MNDLVIELMHGEGKVSVFILERGKKEKMMYFENDDDAIDYLIKYFAGDGQ